jgi:hypothetical protein
MQIVPIITDRPIATAIAIARPSFALTDLMRRALWVTMCCDAISQVTNVDVAGTRGDLSRHRRMCGSHQAHGRPARFLAGACPDAFETAGS